MISIIYKNLKPLLFFLILGNSNLYAQNSKFDQLKAIFQKGEVFEADFVHAYYDSYTNETVSSDGRIWIGEKEYKLESEGQILVVAGDTSKIYDSYRNRLIISDYLEEDDDFAPSRMLNGVDSTYTVYEVELSNEQTKIELKTDDDFALFLLVEIVLNKDGIPISIEAHDYSDNIITTSFNSGKFVQKQSDIFQLQYPDTAEIIDTRY